jgi:hypothetical protein
MPAQKKRKLQGGAVVGTEPTKTTSPLRAMKAASKASKRAMEAANKAAEALTAKRFTCKKKKTKKDPNKPKKAKSAWLVYYTGRRKAVAEAHPTKTFGDITRDISVEWKNLFDKTKYNNEAATDKERYANDMKTYTASAKTAVKTAAKKSKNPAAKKTAVSAIPADIDIQKLQTVTVSQIQSALGKDAKGSTKKTTLLAGLRSATPVQYKRLLNAAKLAANTNKDTLIQAIENHFT